MDPDAAGPGSRPEAGPRTRAGAQPLALIIELAAAFAGDDVVPKADWPEIEHVDWAGARTRPVHFVAPPFPDGLGKRIDVDCDVLLDVGTDGAVKLLAVLDTCPEPFAVTVRGVADQWTFQPVIDDGQPLRVVAGVRLNFVRYGRNEEVKPLGLDVFAPTHPPIRYPINAAGLGLDAVVCYARIHVRLATGEPEQVEFQNCPPAFEETLRPQLQAFAWRPMAWPGSPEITPYYLNIVWEMPRPEGIEQRPAPPPVDPFDQPPYPPDAPARGSVPAVPTESVAIRRQGEVDWGDLGELAYSDTICRAIVFVSPKGKPYYADMRECPAILAPAASAALHRWRFEPVEIDGVAASYQVRIAVSYVKPAR